MERHIILNVEYTMKPGRREAFVQAVKDTGILAKIRGEEGCVRYEYFAALDEPTKLLLVEEWADQAALDSHQGREHMEELKILKPNYVAQTTLRRLTEPEE